MSKPRPVLVPRGTPIQKVTITVANGQVNLQSSLPGLLTINVLAQTIAMITAEMDKPRSGLVVPEPKGEQS